MFILIDGISSYQEGEIYDSPGSTKSISSFIETYSIQLDELLNPDIESYRTFNEFFYRYIQIWSLWRQFFRWILQLFRELKPDARPVQNEDDPTSICSAADCRLTVYPTIDLAKKFWVKGNAFTVPALLNVSPDSEQAQVFDGASFASFRSVTFLHALDEICSACWLSPTRLAPADYHRFHSPIDGTIGDIVDIPGEYYTVNPQAVNEPGFDVFTANRRSVLYMTHARSGLPIAFVAIGAMLVSASLPHLLWHMLTRRVSCVGGKYQVDWRSRERKHSQERRWTRLLRVRRQYLCRTFFQRSCEVRYSCYLPNCFVGCSNELTISGSMKTLWKIRRSQLRRSWRCAMTLLFIFVNADFSQVGCSVGHSLLPV